MASYTKAPWLWREFGGRLVLVGQHSDVPIVMDFEREGMQSAGPRFGVEHESGLRLMERDEKLCHATRLDFVRSHPDARLIESAPRLAEALETIARMDAAIASTKGPRLARIAIEDLDSPPTPAQPEGEETST